MVDPKTVAAEKISTACAADGEETGTGLLYARGAVRKNQPVPIFTLARVNEIYCP